MKRILPVALLLASLFSNAAAGGDNPVMPAEIVLSNGDAFKVEAVVRWLSDGVVIQHPGGADPFHYAYLRADSRAAWQAYKLAVDKARTARAAPPPPGAAENNAIVVGQIFAKGRGAPYRFAGAIVRFYDLATVQRALGQHAPQQQTLPLLAAAKTNEDGVFEIALRPGGYLAVVAEHRHYPNGAQALYHWQLPMRVAAGTQRILFDDDNAEVEPETPGPSRP